MLIDVVPRVLNSRSPSCLVSALKFGADGFDTDGFNRNGVHRLHMAARDGDLASLKKLLDSGMNVDIRDRAYNRIGLHWATLYDETASMKLLMERKANLDAVNEHGFSALMMAAHHGHEEGVALLLQFKAETTIRAPLTGKTALD